MNYKAIIVDDDHIVRSYIQGLNIWRDYSIEVIDVARDGEEALEKIQKRLPDLVITDLSMPHMDGIELIKSIREENQSIYILVLSCHNEFDYVKEAMRLGANEYVLKNSFNEKNLAKILENTIGILEQKAKKEKTINLSPHARQAQKFQYFNQLIAGNLTGEEKEKQRKEAGIQEIFLNCAVVDIRMIDWKSTVEMEQYCQIFKEKLEAKSDSTEALYLGEGNFCVFMDFSSERLASQMQQKLISTMAVFHDIIQNESHKFMLGISDVCTGEMSVKQAVSQARQMVKVGFYIEDSTQYYSGGEGADISDWLPGEADEFKENIQSYLREDKLKELVEKLEQITYLFQKYKCDPNKVIKWVKEMDHIMDVERDVEAYKEIHNIREVEAICYEYKEMLYMKACKEIPKHLSPGIKNALEYMHLHYREKIGLTEVAEEVHLSSVYLSSLFAKEMGVGFSKYLLQLRIETAKKLLVNTNYKVKAVAEQAGFFDYHYFARVFRNLYGCSPVDYRKMNM